MEERAAFNAADRILISRIFLERLGYWSAKLQHGRRVTSHGNRGEECNLPCTNHSRILMARTPSEIDTFPARNFAKLFFTGTEYHAMQTGAYVSAKQASQLAALQHTRICMPRSRPGRFVRSLRLWGDFPKTANMLHSAQVPPADMLFSEVLQRDGSAGRSSDDETKTRRPRHGNVGGGDVPGFSDENALEQRSLVGTRMTVALRVSVDGTADDGKSANRRNRTPKSQPLNAHRLSPIGLLGLAACRVAGVEDESEIGERFLKNPTTNAAESLCHVTS